MANIRAKYKGSGFHSSIPARDLTVDEYDRLTDEQRVLVEQGGLYDLSKAEGGTKAPEPEARPPQLGTYETAGIDPPPGVLPPKNVPPGVDPAVAAESAAAAEAETGEKAGGKRG